MARDEAYREAEHKIEEARRSGAKKLDLRSMCLTDLPASLGQLTQVRSLYLSDNQLMWVPYWVELTKLQLLHLHNNQLPYFPGWLGHLTQLQELSLSENRLSELPASLGHLTKLHSLFLDNNQLTTLPDSLEGLTKLAVLDLARNRLTKLPESLGQLTQLRSLRLFANELTSLPEWLGQLTQLQSLVLSGNELTTLPESLGQITPLKSLELADNQLTALPKSMGQLTQLESLYLTGNQLARVPASIGQLTQLHRLDLDNNRLTALPESLERLKALNELFLHGNPRLGLSLEILGPTWEEVSSKGKQAADPRAILAFYFGQRQPSAKPLNEVKLLLVGHGRVGKTSLSKALRGVPHDKDELETPGIERHPLQLTTGKSTITGHVWDFGGQEFLHQTHQFFFSERSIYVVVLGGRQGRPMQEAEYWLRLIRTYGTGSPVVIALNQIKAHPFRVDEHFLKEKYPEVKAVVKTECPPRVGIAPLHTLLGKLAAAMPSVREKIDPAWARVRKHLEKMEDSFVPFARYREICVEQRVKEPEKQETLATILDRLGIALNYRDDPQLRDTSVLKPRWLVDGIYTILRWLHKHETNGELQLEDFSKALKSKKTYPPEMHPFLLALMEKFELCFQMEGEEGVYLVPGLLDENQPRELKQFMSSKPRRIQFRYDDVRPLGFLPRFIVRSHTLSEGQPRWLRGVVLAHGTARALVRGDHEGRVTDVFALGENTEDRVWLTEFILSEMRVLNDRLPVRTFVESEAEPGAWTELELLRDAARRDEGTRTERASGRGTVTVPVKETLREIESAEASAPNDNPLSLFICYAHENERAVKQLIPSLKVLAQRGYIAPWRDTDLVAGDEWDERIKERLSNAQIILFMVSTEFLGSDYITHQERPLAMQLMEEKKAVVVPVILSPCSHPEADFCGLENLPCKGEPVSSYNPRAKAWALVEEGLKKAVEQSRRLNKGSVLNLRPKAER